MFDVKPIIDAMLSALSNVYADKWPIVKDAALQYATDGIPRLQSLSDNRLAGKIDNEFFFDRLADEKTILESQLLSFAVIAKGAAQTAINDAIQIFQDAVDKAGNN